MSVKSLRAQPLDAGLHVRLTATEKLRLIEDADLAALSLSELVRRRYFGRPIVANTDAIVLRELRRLGGLVKHVHTESNGHFTEETAEALNALTAYIVRLSDGR